MEYIKTEDLEAIRSIIEEFEGETVLGKHMFKAVKAYFKQKNKQATTVYTSKTILPKTPKIAKNSGDVELDRMIKAADEALHKHYLKLKKEGKKWQNKSQKNEQIKK
tara:strand:- start:245 stop:565 length:321 start_codon:yes stop_codon:yes gene_type:complete